MAEPLHSHTKHNTLLPFLFLLATILFLPSGKHSEDLDALAIIFVSIILEAVPFMLVGSVVGGCIEAFVSREYMLAFLPRKGWLTVCLAAAAGIVFPICECAVVPVVRRLTGKGLPLGAAIAYLLGGPIVNPIVAASTTLAYSLDRHMTVWRLGFGYALAVIIALAMGKIFTDKKALKAPPTKLRPFSEIAQENICHDFEYSRTSSFAKKIKQALIHAKDDFLAVGHYLIIGAFIASLAQTFLDRSSYLDLSALPFVSVILMMLLAIFLNLCSEADAFIAASFQGLVSMPAQLAFLLTGPMFDLKLLLMYQEVFSKKAIFVLAGLVIVAILLLTLALTFLEENGLWLL